MEAGKREKDILNILAHGGFMTTADIARQLKLSSRTVAASLNQIDGILAGTGMSLVRKPGVGVCLEGDQQSLVLVLQNRNESPLPQTAEERIEFLCFELVQRTDYWTLQDLSDELYISKTTLEKDMTSIYSIFEKYGVSFTRIRGKGTCLLLDESGRRELILRLIQHFWGGNWRIAQDRGRFSYTLEGVPGFLCWKDGQFSLQTVLQAILRFLDLMHASLSDMTLHELMLMTMIVAWRSRTGSSAEISDTARTGTETFRNLQESFREHGLTLPAREFAWLAGWYEKETGIHAGSQLLPDGLDLRSAILQFVPEAEALELDGLIHHIEDALRRCSEGCALANPILSEIKRNFPRAFDQALLLTNWLETVTGLSISEDETAFLAVYIQSYLENGPRQGRYRILLVCGSGKGTSQLMAARLRRIFPQVEISRILSTAQFLNTEVEEDLILTTVPILCDSHPVLVVSPVLGQADQEKIARSLSSRQARSSVFSGMIHRSLIITDADISDPDEAIRILADRLLEEGYVTEEAGASALKRERLNWTSFDGFATPHTSPKFVKKSCLAYMRLKETIEWGPEQVRHVFFLCIKDESVQELDCLYGSLLDIMDERHSRVLEKGSEQDVYNYLKEGIT